MGIREWIIPQDRVFYDLLDKESAYILEGAIELQDAFKNFDRMEERRKDFKDLEHNCDEVVHEIYDKVNRSFITPIDQEDLTKLASGYDDVLDLMNAAMNRLVLFEIKVPTPKMLEFTGIIKASVVQLHAALTSLRKLDRRTIDDACIEVDRLENEADVLFNESVAALFKTGDVGEILKLKEIYEDLETTTDRCEAVSFIIRDILIKHS
ncbi:MAG TPA: DUF47 family protein [Nitrososphaerales archaeon]|nr:DUF47 family protein [Nitrososphaerales archaeon]